METDEHSEDRCLGPAHPRSVGAGGRGGRQSSARRVRDQVHAAIQRGVFREDEALVEEVLTTTLGASRQAVRTALQSLADEGLMIRTRRKGTFPLGRGIRLYLEDIVDDAPERFRLQVLEARDVPTSPLLGSLLKTSESPLRLMEHLFFYDDEAIGIRTTYFSRRFTADGYTGLLGMRRVANVFFGTDDLFVTDTEIGSTIADEATSAQLGVDPGVPLLTRFQVFADPDGLPIQASFDQYRADRVSFRGEPKPPDAAA